MHVSYFCTVIKKGQQLQRENRIRMSFTLLVIFNGN
jgi:hypothetical protein